MLGRLVVCVAFLLAMSAPALADSNVVVLGLRSIEGDDEVANDLTEQLRSAARSVQGWNVSGAAVSMAQMSLAHGCDEVDAACLNEIANGLHAEKIVYGTVRRSNAREDYDFAVNLNLFDAPTGSIVRQVDDTLPRSQTDFQSLAGRAEKLVARLSSITAGGGIEIQANVPDAEVLVNGQLAGTTRDGALRIAGLQPGSYRIEIRKPGYVPHVSTVSVMEGADTSIAAVLSTIGAAPPSESEPIMMRPRGHNLAWLGWTLVGVSAASLIGMGVSLAIIDGINNDSLYLRYRDLVARGNMSPNLRVADVVGDVCHAADDGNAYGLSQHDLSKVQSKCHTAATFEVLQWVFLGTAIASAGVGTYFILSADHDDDHPDRNGEARRTAPRFTLVPSVGFGRASLTTSLRF